MELKAKIAREIDLRADFSYPETALGIADAILAIPEIRDALEHKARADHHAELNRRAWEA